MIYLLWRLLRIRWRWFWCGHHVLAGGSPAMKVYRDLMEGRITLDEYRADRSPINVSRCLACGKEWVR